MTVGIIYGTWDLFHQGHLNILTAASQMCDILYVGIFSDEVVLQYKKKNPIFKQGYRLMLISRINFGECRVMPFIVERREVVNPHVDFIFLSDDMADKKLAMIDDGFIGQKVYINRTPNISSGMIRQRCIDAGKGM